MIDQRVIDLYDEYTHAPLDRRVFMERLARMMGSALAASQVLPLLMTNSAQAGQISPDDIRLLSQRVKYNNGDTTLSGYLSQPHASAGKLPAVIVIHENRGLNAHIEDVARRLAAAGFLALAPDLLSPIGGTPADEDKARNMIGTLDSKQTVSHLRTTLNYLAQHTHSNGKVGAVGFCWGGGMVGELAVNEPKLGAGAVYYGRQPASADVAKIKAPLLLNYAGLDIRINDGIPAFEQALKAAGKTFELYHYEGVNHAFNNDTSAARYDKAAAELAWGRTVAFLHKYLA